MAKLDAAKRKSFPKKDFAGPGRSYPDEDRSHAIDAKARATQQWEKGKLSTSEREEIFRKADAKLKRRK